MTMQTASEQATVSLTSPFNESAAVFLEVLNALAY